MTLPTRHAGLADQSRIPGRFDGRMVNNYYLRGHLCHVRIRSAPAVIALFLLPPFRDPPALSERAVFRTSPRPSNVSFPRPRYSALGSPPPPPGPPRGMPIFSPPSRVCQSQLVGTTSSASTTRRTLTLILSPAPRAPCSADLADAGRWMSG